MILKANCKINIGLDILRRRDDGFHELETVMIPVRGLYDELRIERTEGVSVEFEQSGLVVDCPLEKNICVKTYNLMRERYGVGGLSISLDKRVPFGAGLGGGSSDATAVIVAINELYDLSLSEEQLIDCASELGSDTAFFVRNSPQLCKGRGEVMSPVDINLVDYNLVLVKPQDGVSTGEAFSGVRPCVPPITLAERISQPIERWQENIGNDFERHIFISHPKLAAIKASLIEQGAIYASMSGSGSTLYGIFPKDKKYRSPFDDLFIHMESL